MKDFLPWLGKQWDRMYRILDCGPWLSEQMDRMIRKNQKIFDCLVFFLLICAGITVFIVPIYAVVFDGHDRSILLLCIPGCGLVDLLPKGGRGSGLPRRISASPWVARRLQTNYFKIHFESSELVAVSLRSNSGVISMGILS